MAKADPNDPQVQAEIAALRETIDYWLWLQSLFPDKVGGRMDGAAWSVYDVHDLAIRERGWG